MKKILILLFIISAQLAFAQEEEEADPCVQNIEIAQQRYDNGRIQDIQPLLSDCLESGVYTKAEKSQALRLLTLSYIFLEQDDQAEAYMLRLLETNHEFRVNPAIDPTEFINLHERFRYEPLFNVGGRWIFNYSTPIVTGLNSSLDLNDADNLPQYNYIFAYIGFGVNFEWEFYDNIILYPEIHYKTISISRTSYQRNISGSGDYFTLESYEDQNWLSLPVSAKYNFSFPTIPKLKLYTNLGASMDVLLSVSEPADANTGQVSGAAQIGFPLDAVKDKNRLNFGIFAGGGVTYKAGEGFISLEVRYSHGLGEVTKSENILLPVDPRSSDTFNQDDIYRINFVAISLGYTLNLYFPKQLR